MPANKSITPIDFKKQLVENYEKLKTYSEVIGRAQLMSKLGISFNSDRDLYEALGYPQELKYSDYAANYQRNDIASAIINRPVDVSWRGGFVVSEPEKGEEGNLAKTWNALNKRLKITDKFKRLDKLSCLGRYGILFIGYNDAKSADELKRPVSGKAKIDILYLKPFGEGSATIKTYETESTNERYGMPKTYEITMKVPGQGTKTDPIEVHYSRVLHVAAGLLEDEIEGTPVLEAVFNRIKDIEKLVGGSAEMFWKGARPGYQAELDPNYFMTTGTEDDLQDQFDEFEHKLRRILIMQGAKLNPLTPQVEDPKGHIDAQIDMICAATGIPRRILLGSERGELASTQDRENWFDKIDSRREEYLETTIIRPFIDLCIQKRILPDPVSEEAGYNIKWYDLRSPGDKERSDVGKIRAEALDKYSNNPASSSIVPHEAFLKHFLGLTEEEISEIVEMSKKAQLEEEEDFDDGNGEGEGQQEDETGTESR